MSRSWRPYTPPLALATLNAASMPIFIFWPSSLAGPVNGAEIPSRISLSLTPRMALPTLLSCSSGLGIGDNAACWPCTGEGAACAIAGGAAPAIAATPAAGTCSRFAGASFAVETCAGEESGSTIPARCNSGFPKMTNKATRAANTTTVPKRPSSPNNPSCRHAEGTATGSGLKDAICRSLYSSLDQGAVDGADRGRSASGVVGCWRAHLGAYFLSSESAPSSLGVLIYHPVPLLTNYSPSCFRTT